MATITGAPITTPKKDAMLSSKYPKTEQLLHSVLMLQAAFIRMDFQFLLAWVGADNLTVLLVWMYPKLCISWLKSAGFTQIIVTTVLSLLGRTP